ncbi:MAG TPA: two-component system response regulator, partial [Cyanobacteria bacterium UBA11162]|nr:two-component system response regulator [Cyanobacteria bacterium UBA11162]
EPDAVIVDWHLPTMDGYEISHSLHNSPTTAQIKVLALTTPDL